MKENKKFIIIGSGGHASVIIDLLESCGNKIGGILINDYSEKLFLGYPVLGDDNLLHSFNKKNFLFAIGVGTLNHSMTRRKKIYNKIKALQLMIPPLIHNSAVVSSRTVISEGCQVLMGSKLGVNVSLGVNTIINSNAIIDHDVIIGDHCHIAPSVTICGKAILGNQIFLGAGSTVINDISIANNCTIGASSLINKNIALKGKYFGIPAKKR